MVGIGAIGGSRQAVSDVAGGIPTKKFLRNPKTLRISLPCAVLCNSKQTFSDKMCLVFILCEENGKYSRIFDAASVCVWGGGICP